MQNYYSFYLNQIEGSVLSVLFCLFQHFYYMSPKYEYQRRMFCFRKGQKNIFTQLKSHPERGPAWASAGVRSGDFLALLLAPKIQVEGRSVVSIVHPRLPFILSHFWEAGHEWGCSCNGAIVCYPFVLSWVKIQMCKGDKGWGCFCENNESLPRLMRGFERQ